MHIHELQTHIDARWGSSEYGPSFLAREDQQRDAQHAVLHIGKAFGKLAAALDELDHAQNVHASGIATSTTVVKALADVVICTARVASEWPGTRIDLELAIAERLAEKFPLEEPPTEPAHSVLELQNRSARELLMYREMVTTIMRHRDYVVGSLGITLVPHETGIHGTLTISVPNNAQAENKLLLGLKSEWPRLTEKINNAMRDSRAFVERERCAKIAEDLGANEVAAAIRQGVTP